MSEPTKVIASPFKVYMAPAETADPGADAQPDSNSWKLLADTTDIVEGGIKQAITQKLLEHRSDGSTHVKKVFRQEEDVSFEFETDITGVQMLGTLTDGIVESHAAGAGTRGYKKTRFSRGRDVTFHAFLLEGPSTELAGSFARFYIPRAYFSSEIAPQYSKGKVASYKITITAVTGVSTAPGDEIGYMYEIDAPAT